MLHVRGVEGTARSYMRVWTRRTRSRIRVKPSRCVRCAVSVQSVSFLLIADFRAEVLENGAEGADHARGKKW